MQRVTLSFDNGPDPDVTPRVLDVLADRGVTAHFFVLGKHLAARAGRRLVVPGECAPIGDGRIVAELHELVAPPGSA